MRSVCSRPGGQLRPWSWPQPPECRLGFRPSVGTMRSLSVLILSLTLAAGASAVPSQPVPRLIFPVVGTVSYTDDFGQARAGGAHQGNDILAARHAPAVAVAPGTVKFWTTSANAGCMLYLYGDSGTTYLYIHLNNDLTARNDNQGSCVAGTAYAPGLKSGAHVAAGQLVGYVGDSGDADGIHPHLHFELHPNDGAAVSPYRYLRKAQPLIFYAKPGSKVSLSVAGTIRSALDVEADEDQPRTRAFDRGRCVRVARSAQRPCRAGGPAPGSARDRLHPAGEDHARCSARRSPGADCLAHRPQLEASLAGPAATRASNSSGGKRRSCTFSSHHVAPASPYAAHSVRSPADE